VRHLIDVDADGRGVVRRIFARADAADAELGLAAAELAVDLHVGHGVFQVIDDRDAFFIQLLAADDAEGDAHVLAGLLATLGGDDDLVDARGLIPRSGVALGVRVGEGGQGQQADRRRQ